MNIGLLSILHNKIWDFRQDMAQTYADALKNAIELQLDNDIEKQHGYFLSKKGYKDKETGKTVGANFEDKLYVGNIHYIENHLYWDDEELADDDQIINVVVVDGPITREGGGCSYGSKDWRDQVMYANTIPQVVGHLFMINTPGGEAASRNDYDMMIADCREKGKPTVAFIDGMCCSSGVNLACRLDRVIVRNPKDEFGCIGTMAAFWAVAHDTVDQDGYRYVELVGKDCPEKNAWWREAAKGEYEKLQADLDRDTEQFHQTVRENRPLVTDEMLSGKVFEAQEVIPALVDEIGDMERAIECVFALANEEMQAARFMTAPEPEADAPGTVAEPEKETTHQINNDMTEEEKKAAEAEAAQAAAQEEAPATEQPAEEAPSLTPDPSPKGEGSEQPAAEEEKPTDEEAPAEEQPAEEQPADEGIANANTPSDGIANPAEQPAAENAQADIDKMQETLHNAETMIADKDKEIADLKADKDTLSGLVAKNEETIEEMRGFVSERDKTIEANGKAIAEKDALIEKLQKQVAELKAEVKELSEKPAPMVDADAGIPAGNGTGEAPKMHEKRITRENMTYEHCREVAKERRTRK